MAKTLLHLNGNLLCAVDIATTGPNPFEHEIWGICVLPLDSNIKPYKPIIPFYTCIKPENPGNVVQKYINREELSTALLRGMDRGMAADLILEWFDSKLELVPGKNIQALAYNWPNVYSFLLQWLGFHQTNVMFHSWYRDIIPHSLHANDVADLNVEQVPYPKSNQSFLEIRLNVENAARGEPMADCLAIAEMWNKSLKRLFT